MSIVLSVRRAACTCGRRRRRSPALRRAARDVLVGAPRPLSSRFSRRGAGAGAAASASAVTAWAAPEDFRRRRRRRPRDAGFEPSGSEGSAAVVASATACVPVSSWLAAGFEERRRDLERERPWLFFAGAVACALPAPSGSAAGAALGGPASSAGPFDRLFV